MFDDEPSLKSIDNIWEELDSHFKGSDFDDWADYDEVDLEFDD
jgi:hypothetical protein